MKQFIFIIPVFCVLFFACSPKQKTESENLLLYNHVEVLYFTDTSFFYNKFQYDFLKNLLEAGISGKIQTYDFPLTSFDFSRTPDILPTESVKNILKISNDTILKKDSVSGKEIIHIFTNDYRKDARNIYFVEDWEFSKNLKFTKTVKYYAPVRYYYSALMPDKQMKSIPFVVQNQDISNIDKRSLVQIGKNISYILNIETDLAKGSIINGLNRNNVISILIDSVVSGKIKVYDLDLSKFELSSKILSLDEIKKNLGETIETVEVNDINGNPMGTKTDTLKATDRKYEIKALFFVENWFYDPATFSILKDVIGIGPVREYENPEVSGMMMKTIPFIISMQ